MRADYLTDCCQRPERCELAFCERSAYGVASVALNFPNGFSPSGRGILDEQEGLFRVSGRGGSRSARAFSVYIFAIPAADAETLCRTEFRTEIFNIFNHPNFANPPATLPNALGGIQPNQPFSATSAGSAFGVLNSTVTNTVGLGTNRQVQFALKLNF